MTTTTLDRSPSTRMPSRLVALIVLALSLVFGPTSSPAGTSGVRDGAGFFSDNATRRAEVAIAELQRTAKKEMLVETLARIPADLAQGLDLRDKSAMNRFFEKWSVDKAREHKVDGIYVLITREPSHLQVVVGNETQRKLFTQNDRQTLVDTMLGQLRAKRPDDALLDGVGFVGKTVGSRIAGSRPSSPGPTSPVAESSAAATARNPQSGASSIPWGGILVLLAVVVIGVMIVVRVLRALFGGRGRNNNGMQGGFAGAGAGGGGFMRSLLGGIFGAAAGMWLYDAFTGHGTAWGSDHSTGATPDDSGGGSGGVDTDYSSSGGDFGDSSGGGDFGGGDSGGGGDF